MFNKMTEAIEQNKLHEFRLNQNFQSTEKLASIKTNQLSQLIKLSIQTILAAKGRHKCSFCIS